MVAVVACVLAGCADDPGDSSDPVFAAGDVVAADLSAPLGVPEAAPVLGDPVQDAMALRCHDGSLRSCDDLFQRGAVGTAYVEYGRSCGGRLDPPPDPGEAPNCRLRRDPTRIDRPEPAPEGSSAELRDLAVRCEARGGLEACDALLRASVPHTDVEDFAITCGWRIDDTRPNACVGLHGIPLGAPPQDLGGDDALDELARECFEARMNSCDLLYARSNRGSRYKGYAGACGGRLEQPEPLVAPQCDLRFNDPLETTRRRVPEALRDDSYFGGLANVCALGSMASCDELFEVSPLSSDYEAYGATCGERLESRRHDLSLDPATDLRFDRKLSAAGECEARFVNVSPF